MKLEINKKWFSILIWIILCAGICIRFYYEFIDWSFNGDEVNLGLNIIRKNYLELLSPLERGQSGPPLFLILEKFFLTINKPFVSLKILSFIFSCGSLFLFERILKDSFSKSLRLLLLAAFCFSPFILSNSLTLKQYSADLFLGLVAVNYFVTQKNKLLTFCFFCLFCLMSNVGPFFCVSFCIYFLFKNYPEIKGFQFKKIIYPLVPFILAPVPYVIYFIWFMARPGAELIKSYMVNYWQGSFLPINSEIFKWIALQGNSISLFFFSSYPVLQYSLLIIFIFGLLRFLIKRISRLEYKIDKIIFIYIVTIVIQVILSALELYPFSDRLFLWIAPGIFFILGYGISELVYLSKIYFSKKVFFILYLPLAAAILLFPTYLSPKSNDVLSLNSFVNTSAEDFIITPKAKSLIQDWLLLTKLQTDNFEVLRNSKLFEKQPSKSGNLLIAHQSIKSGHKRKKSQPEPIIADLLKKDKAELVYRVNGYVIYKIK